MGVASYIYTLTLAYLFCVEPWANALAHPAQSILVPAASSTLHTAVQPDGDHGADPSSSHSGSLSSGGNNTAHDLFYALGAMQEAYFALWQGTWPSSIDWTAAVLNTDVGGTLLSLSAAADSSSWFDASNEDVFGIGKDDRAFENMIDYFFDQSCAFYFGENAVSLRSQAFDDMQWVVLDWLESIKFQELHSDLHYSDSIGQPWHRMQYRVPAAHRARLFYHLASSEGWNTTLCGGGMLWSPYTTPYKNAITNELYISSSIGMYLYHPGDKVDSPFFMASDENSYRYPHNPLYLHNAIKAYDWFKDSNMTGACGLIGDGFHIRGWKSPEDPGTRKCDILNPMLYTYNQGVFLSGLRGLWMATLSAEYLHDGHEQTARLIGATGWPNTSSSEWAGLGRGGVLEDACDSAGDCSQDAQTFKGIFFHHLTEFCRPLSPQEHRFLQSMPAAVDGKNWRFTFNWHQARCRLYRPWIEHNAHAALVTRDHDGKFGMWWGIPYNPDESSSHARMAALDSPLPAGAVDYRNYYGPGTNSDDAADSAGEYIPGLEKPNPPRRTGSKSSNDLNDRGRGRTVETQSGGVSVLRALYQWKNSADLAESDAL